jgi:hypothetical protein
MQRKRCSAKDAVEGIQWKTNDTLLLKYKWIIDCFSFDILLDQNSTHTHLVSISNMGFLPNSKYPFKFPIRIFVHNKNNRNPSPLSFFGTMILVRVLEEYNNRRGINQLFLLEGLPDLISGQIQAFSIRYRIQPWRSIGGIGTKKYY